LAGVNGPELTRSVGETVKGIAALNPFVLNTAFPLE